MDKKHKVCAEFKDFAKQVTVLFLVPSAITAAVLATGNEMLRSGSSATVFVGTMVAGSLAIGASVSLILHRLDR